MVALKLDQVFDAPAVVGLKQERRGGIETQFPNDRHAARGKKQERRGGIETASSRSWRAWFRMEAGTPWWH